MVFLGGKADGEERQPHASFAQIPIQWCLLTKKNI
jgi:hypothetical protein